MSDINRQFEQLIEQFTKWAEKQDDIRGALILGSRARKEIPADEWSDLDLIIFTSEPDRYISDTKWLDNLGKYYLTFLEKTPDGEGVERRVLFDGGLDVDFPIVPVEAIKNSTFSVDVMLVLHRGFRILIDKDGYLNSISKDLPELPEPVHPSPKEYDNCVNDFLYHAVFAVKKFKRGELLYAKSNCDSYMKYLLLRMIKWHARAKYGLEYDVWHDSRFFERWADPEFVKGLSKTYAVYSVDDFPRALRETINLFRKAALDTADMLSFAYPSEGDRYAVNLIEDYLARK